jgi:hypothetical protein
MPNNNNNIKKKRLREREQSGREWIIMVKLTKDISETINKK